MPPKFRTIFDADVLSLDEVPGGSVLKRIPAPPEPHFMTPTSMTGSGEDALVLVFTTLLRRPTPPLWEESSCVLFRLPVSGVRGSESGLVAGQEAVPHVLRQTRGGYAGLRWGSPPDGKNLLVMSQEFRVLKTLSVGKHAAGLTLHGESLLVTYSEEAFHAGGRVMAAFDVEGKRVMDPRVQAVTSFGEFGEYAIDDVAQLLIDASGGFWVFTDSSGSGEWLVFDALGRLSEPLRAVARSSQSVRGFVIREFVVLPDPDFKQALVIHCGTGDQRQIPVRSTGKLRPEAVVDFVIVGGIIHLLQYPDGRVWRLSGA